MSCRRPACSVLAVCLALAAPAFASPALAMGLLAAAPTSVRAIVLDRGTQTLKVVHPT